VSWSKVAHIWALPEIAALLDGAAPTGPRDRSCDPRAIEALTATASALLGFTDALMDLSSDVDLAAACILINAKALRLLAKIAHWLQRPLKVGLLLQMGEETPEWMGEIVWFLATTALWRLIGPVVEAQQRELCTSVCVQVQASGGEGRGGGGGGREGQEG
jgi:hypothetical protein